MNFRSCTSLETPPGHVVSGHSANLPGLTELFVVDTMTFEMNRTLSAVFVGSRRHPRAQLNLRVRIRWPSPLAMRFENTHTIDASRKGLLVQRAESCEPQTRVWVAFPFDPQDKTIVPPETPARVVRVERDSVGGFHVALQLELPAREEPWPPAIERRRHVRIPMALPILVRQVNMPCPEESMTQNISRSGVRFETFQAYRPGEEVFGKIPLGELADAGEILGRVTRVESAEDASWSGGGRPCVNPSMTCVAVQWTARPKS